jgi:hypothetical protein
VVVAITDDEGHALVGVTPDVIARTSRLVRASPKKRVRIMTLHRPMSD